MIGLPFALTICDFCGSPLGRGWSYPCRDFDADIVAINAAGQVAGVAPHRYAGPWLACDACHAAVESGDRTALARRGMRPPLTDDPVLLDGVLQLQDAFRAHRTGPATPLLLA